MQNQKHILVICQYFYPEQFRINDICEEWVKRGYKVTVITGIPNYPKGKFFDGYGYFSKRTENHNGVNIIRLPIIARHNSKLSLALNYLSYIISGFVWSVFTNIKADNVFIYQLSPVTMALPGIWYAKRKKTKSMIYVTDLWPESIEIIGGLTNRTVIKIIGDIVDYIYKNCDVIFTSSNSFIKSINNRGIPLSKLKFWPQYAEEFYTQADIYKVDKIRKEIFKSERFNITFAGNIGFAQGLDVLPETALLLKDKKIVFNIIGDGRYLQLLIKKVKELKVEDLFNFLPRQSVFEIPNFMAASDAALISLATNKLSEITLPAKLQSCLACGIPLVVSANGEIQQVVRKSGAGVSCNSGDPESLAKVITHLLSLPMRELNKMRENAHQYYIDHYEKHKLLDEMDEYLNAGGSLHV